MTIRVVLRNSASMASSKGTYHKIESFKDRATRARWFMQSFSPPIILINLGLFRQALIVLSTLRHGGFIR